MQLWPLDRSFTFLNHGSFGSCPLPVLEEQNRLRARLEAQPLRFMLREKEALEDAVRSKLGAFLGADPGDLVFLSNATSGVNTVLRSLRFSAGDELLVTDHGYNACSNAVRFVAEQAGATVVVANVPFPLESPEQVTRAVMARVSSRTRLAVIDHVTSPTGLIFPIGELVSRLKEHGVETLVDGAHAPGMLPLDLAALDAGYYTGNLHKWVGTPKGAAFLYVRRALQPAIRPLVISHGANSPRTDKSRFQLEFEWPGTMDPTPWLCAAKALEVMAGIEPGGWPALMRRNHALALRARDLLTATRPAPDEMLGSLVTWALPDGDARATQDALFANAIEVPVFAWPIPPKRLIRIACAAYNTLADYQRLAEALEQLAP
ncbi:MAG: aminotransferase class V-fold PLP-dependent enzyme [Archangiaceae bacterium]|nr:aminotransferase class V-fold PLP-dependent enzyme [Archangiaceae bacterium]